jgi:hypothetical protein
MHNNKQLFSLCHVECTPCKCRENFSNDSNEYDEGRANIKHRNPFATLSKKNVIQSAITRVEIKIKYVMQIFKEKKEKERETFSSCVHE